MTESDWRKLVDARFPRAYRDEIIAYFEPIIASATSQGARDKSTAWCACGDALEEKPIWRELKAKIYIHGKEISRVIDHYEYYCFGCYKTYALVQVSPSKEVEEA